MTVMSILKKIVPTVTTLASVLFMPGVKGGSSIVGAIDAKNYRGAAQTFIAGFTGINIDLSGGTGAVLDFEPFEILNPIEIEVAPWPKIALWTGITMEGISKVGAFIRNLWSDVS